MIESTAGQTIIWIDVRWIAAALAVGLLLSLMNEYSFIEFIGAYGPIKRLRPWRQRLEIWLPGMRFFRHRTTEERRRDRSVKALRDAAEAAREPALSPSIRKFQRICGAVDALQETENSLNIKRASRFGVAVPEHHGSGSPDAYREGFVRESERLRRRVVRQKDRLVWWLVRHGVDPSDLQEVVVSPEMVDKISKRLGIKSDGQDLLGFAGVDLEILKKFRQERQERSDWGVAETLKMREGIDPSEL